jgi:O-antigen/teichoic acid export membrane protein
MGENLLGKFLRQFSHYSAGQLLVLVSTFVSFPILTRIFTVADYGIMNLVSDALLILVAFSKGGLQNSIVRFYDEIGAGKEKKQKLNKLVTSVLWGGSGFALVVTIICMVAIAALPDSWLGQNGTRTLLLVSCGLIFFRAGESFLLGFLRAEQQTVFLNGYKVVSKYLSLGVVLLFVFFISRSLTGFYCAQMMAMIPVLAVLLIWRLRKNPPHAKNWSREIFRRAMVYGFPLIGFELISMLLAYADRYLIQYYEGAEAVGLYSAAYNMVDYVKDLIVVPLSTAVMPIYMKAWFKKGPEVTQNFLKNALRSYTFLAVPLIFGCTVIGKDFIHVLASEKFIDGHVIIPWVITGLMINGALPILAAGLYIQDKTNKLVGLLAFTSLFNLAANLILIPKFGIQGAAMAKLFSYLILAVLATYLSNRVVKFPIAWRALARYVLAGAIMYLVAAAVRVSSPVLELAAEIATGTVVYFAIVFIIDTGARQKTLRAARVQLEELTQ